MATFREDGIELTEQDVRISTKLDPSNFGIYLEVSVEHEGQERMVAQYLSERAGEPVQITDLAQRAFVSHILNRRNTYLQPFGVEPFSPAQVVAEDGSVTLPVPQGEAITIHGMHCMSRDYISWKNGRSYEGQS